MQIEVQLTAHAIPETIAAPISGSAGAWAEFRGIVRGEENCVPISALEYEAYPGMAEREISRLLADISRSKPCLAAKVIHRTGIIPVGDTAIYVGIAARHRAEAFELLATFMDRLKQDVPIWKRRAIPAAPPVVPKSNPNVPMLSLDAALEEIIRRVLPLPPAPTPLADAMGRTLREAVHAAEDSPDCARSTRDGYAVRCDDDSETFRIVDTLHAADWKPRALQTGEAVRVATGSALPAENLRVVMQENVDRHGDTIKILKRESNLNLRQRGEDWRAGDVILPAGQNLNASRLALLAAAGCVRPAVSPRLRVVHFTTGDEIIPAAQTPERGQVRDSNSVLVRGLLEPFGGTVVHVHLPENFDAAKEMISRLTPPPGVFDLILVSGGASVGDKDFTRPLLEWLGFNIVFQRVDIRPGAPLIFGMNENRIAFGLPGNPLSHLVCFHLFVAAALARLSGTEPQPFQSSRLAERLEDAPNPRETLWPARLSEGKLFPLKWSSSGDVASFAGINAFIRVPKNGGTMDAGKEIEFLPV